MKILISPFCRPMRDGRRNPKDFPHWLELESLLSSDGHELIQVGSEGESQIARDFRKDLSFMQLKELIEWCDLFISVDTWLQHAARHYGRRGIVIFGQSDPLIFGYPENVNLLRDRTWLRRNQFLSWEQAEYDEGAFVGPEEVMEEVRKWKLT